MWPWSMGREIMLPGLYLFFWQQGLRRVWWFLVARRHVSKPFLVAVLQPSLESWGSKISVFFIWSYYYTFIWWLYWSGIDWNRIFIISIDQWSVSNALNTPGGADNRRLMCNLYKKDWARLKANFDPLFTYHFNLKLHELSRGIIHIDLKNTEESGILFNVLLNSPKPKPNILELSLQLCDRCHIWNVNFGYCCHADISF